MGQATRRFSLFARYHRAPNNRNERIAKPAKFPYAEPMRYHDLMNDPFFAGILYAIESEIHDGDQQAAAKNIKLTDSNVRSLLIKAVHAAEGKPPRPVAESASPKDQALAELLDSLIAVRESLRCETTLPDGTTEDQALSTADWTAALSAVKESCAIRTSNEPGSRGYLNFLRSFLAAALDQ